MILKKTRVLGSVELVSAAAIWGGMFVVVKAIVTEIPPIQLVWLRYLVGAVVLLGMAWARRIQWHWDWSNLMLSGLAGVVGDTLSIVAQETGTWLSSAQLGSVVTTATPAFMMLFSWPLLQQRPKWYHWVSLGLASLGVWVIVGHQFSGRHFILGVLCLLLAALTWALMSVLLQLISPEYDGLQVTFLATVVALVCLTPVVGIQHRVLQTVAWGSPHVILSIFYLGAVSTALAFFLWNQGLRHFNSPASGIFFLIQPVVGSLLGWWCLQEPLSGGFFVGLGLILLSVLVTYRFG